MASRHHDETSRDPRRVSSSGLGCQTFNLEDASSNLVARTKSWREWQALKKYLKRAHHEYRKVGTYYIDRGRDRWMFNDPRIRKMLRDGNATCGCNRNPRRGYGGGYSNLKDRLTWREWSEHEMDRRFPDWKDR